MYLDKSELTLAFKLPHKSTKFLENFKAGDGIRLVDYGLGMINNDTEEEAKQFYEYKVATGVLTEISLNKIVLVTNTEIN